MCYRFKNLQDEAAFRKFMLELGRVFRQEPTDKRFSFYHTNGFAHELLPVVAMHKPDDISYMHWGLIPAGLKSTAEKDAYWKMGYTLNARSEDIFSTWSFKNVIRDKRCLVPATGFFEWRNLNKEKFPYLVSVKNKYARHQSYTFCFAGVYDQWIDKQTGEVLESFAIITTKANALMQKVHVNAQRAEHGGRMPVILHSADYDKWLHRDTTREELIALMSPYPAEEMEAYTISKAITSRKVDPNCEETLRPQFYEMLGDECRLNMI